MSLVFAHAPPNDPGEFHIFTIRQVDATLGMGWGGAGVGWDGVGWGLLKFACTCKPSGRYQVDATKLILRWGWGGGGGGVGSVKVRLKS